MSAKNCCTRACRLSAAWSCVSAEKASPAKELNLMAMRVISSEERTTSRKRSAGISGVRFERSPSKEVTCSSITSNADSSSGVLKPGYKSSRLHLVWVKVMSSPNFLPERSDHRERSRRVTDKARFDYDLWSPLSEELNIKSNMHNIAVFDGIFLTFQAQFAFGLGLVHAAQLDQVIIGDHFCADKAFLQIGMDRASSLVS